MVGSQSNVNTGKLRVLQIPGRRNWDLSPRACCLSRLPMAPGNPRGASPRSHGSRAEAYWSLRSSGQPCGVDGRQSVERQHGQASCIADSWASQLGSVAAGVLPITLAHGTRYVAYHAWLWHPPPCIGVWTGFVLAIRWRVNKWGGCPIELVGGRARVRRVWWRLTHGGHSRLWGVRLGFRRRCYRAEKRSGAT